MTCTVLECDGFRQRRTIWEVMAVYVLWYYFKTFCKLLLGHQKLDVITALQFCGEEKKIGLQGKVAEIPPHPITVPNLMSITWEEWRGSAHMEKEGLLFEPWPDCSAFTPPPLPASSLLSFPKVDWPSYSSRHRGVAPYSSIQGWKLISSKSSSYNPFHNIIISLHLHFPPLRALMQSGQKRKSLFFFFSFLLPTFSNSFPITWLRNHQLRVTVCYYSEISIPSYWLFVMLYFEKETCYDVFSQIIICCSLVSKS